MRPTVPRALTGPAVCALAVLVGCAGAALPADASAATPSAPPVRAASAATSAPLAPADSAGHARAASAGPSGTADAAGASAAFRWSARASSPLGARTSPLVVWAGRQLLEIGGLVAKGSQATSAGAAFDPATGRWHRIAPVPGNAGVNPDGRYGLSLDPASVWTGTYLAVANGLVKACPKAGPADPAQAPQARTSTAATSSCWTGVALYDPKANRWTALTLPKQLDGLEVSAVTWTGRDVVVGAVNAAAFGTSKGRLALAEYDVATRRWQVITPAVPGGHPARYLDLAFAGGRLLLWSQWDRVVTNKNGFSDYAGVDVLAMNARGAWRNVTGGWPQEQSISTPVLTSDGLLFAPGQIWCGLGCIPPFSIERGYFTNPVTLARKTIPVGPLGQQNAAYVWAGDAIMAVDQNSQVSGPGLNVRPGDMEMYQPGAARWTGLPAVPGHPSSLSVTPVWTGTELLALTDAGRLFALHR
jgi:hypothetical protein